MRTAPRLKIEEALALTIANFPEIEITRSGEHDNGEKWIIFKCSGLSSKEEATLIGQKLGDALSLAGSIGRLGIDIGHSIANLQFSTAIETKIFADHKRKLRPEIHGLQVYEEDSVAIIGLEARGEVSVSNERLSDSLMNWLSKDLKLTDRQRTCSALINDSLFSTSSETQFILRVTAVEALCEKDERGKDYQQAISWLSQAIIEATCSEDTKASILNLLDNSRQASVRQACKKKFVSLLSPKEFKSFDRLYSLRSKFIHDGLGRGTLQHASNEILELATSLLDADLRLNAVRTPV